MAHYTHKISNINEALTGQTISLAGWLHNKRNHGGVLFLDIRAFGEKVQVVVSQEAMIEAVSRVKMESVLKITGVVKLRPSDAANANLHSGNVEIFADAIEVESNAQQIPFQVNSDDIISEDLRLQYRFLDLRTERMRENILLRSSVISYIRKRMEEQEFVEFQTPILTASSPEGARDFLVPSRLNPGKFYALPQAPQQFKQMLMASGFERYFQIAPCFRDEDARADRSPGEFYQLDIEMSFATQEEIFATIEPVLHDIFIKFGKGRAVSPYPFRQITYADSMLKYGNDKPDLRNPIEIFDATNCFEDSKFNIFAQAKSRGEVVRAIPVPQCTKSMEYFKTEMQNFAKLNGAEFGVAYMIFENGTVKTCPIRNAYKISKDREEIHEAEFAQLINSIKKSGRLKDGDGVFFACGKENFTAKLAGLIRTKIGQDLALIDKNKFEFCWIVDFPFYEYNEDEKKIEFSHNPFSMPQGGMDSLLLSQTSEEIRHNIHKLSLDKQEEINKKLPDLQLDLEKFWGEILNIMNDNPKVDALGYMTSKYEKVINDIVSNFKIDPTAIKAYQYDIVCNGIELSSGAIRNHKLDVMFKAFEIAGYTEEQVRTQFAGMVKAFSYGVPPHGGLAPGVDRMVMLLAGTDSIRDIIPFPLNGKAQDLLMNAPSQVSEKQLRELGLQIKKKVVSE